MDDQGLVGAMPTSAMRNTVKHVPHAPLRAPHAEVKPAPTPAKTTAPLAQGGAVGAHVLAPKPSKYDAAIEKAEAVRNAANLPFMLMMPGMVLPMLSAPAKWLKRERTSAVLAGAGEGLLNGARLTSMAKPLHMPADFMQSMANVAAERGGRAAPMAESMAARSVALREGADRLGASIGKFTAPVMNVAGKGLETIGLKTPASTAWKAVSKYPLFAGIAAVAAGAGMTSIWLTRGKQSAEGREALASLTQQLGVDHPLTLAAQKVYSKQQTQTIVSSALSSVGELAFVGMEARPHMDMKAALPFMGAQMGLPMVGQLIVSENPMLDAFAKLQAMEQGRMPADTAQKTYCYRQMIGAMPQVEAKGGVYNRLGASMAAALVKENASLAEVMDLLKDPAKFSAYSVKVSQAQEAAPKADTKTLTPSNDTHAPSIAMPKAHEVPMAKIQAATAANDGVVQSQHRQVG